MWPQARASARRVKKKDEAPSRVKFGTQPSAKCWLDRCWTLRPQDQTQLLTFLLASRSWRCLFSQALNKTLCIEYASTMSMRDRQAGVRCSVLQRHFAEVVPLLTLIHDRFGIDASTSSSRSTPDLSEERWACLDGTVVGLDQHASDASQSRSWNAVISSSATSHHTIYEAVQEAQLQILSLTPARGTTAIHGRPTASSNILLKGYRRPDDRLESFRITSTGRPGLINLFPNSMVTNLVLEKEWHYLFHKIGSERFTWLLVHTSIFVPLMRNGADGTCFVQLTGPALSEPATLKTTSDEQAHSRVHGVPELGQDRTNLLAQKQDKTPEPPVEVETDCAAEAAVPDAARSLKLGKRARGFKRTTSRLSARSAASDADIGASAANAGALARKPSEIVLVRSRMFYARSSRNKAGRVEIGLPSVHVLPRSGCAKELDKVLPNLTQSSGTGQHTASNKISLLRKSRPSPDTANEQKRGYRDADSIFTARRTRHLAKYVFPRQFGLHNVFTGARDFDTTTQPFRDYTVREAEIKTLGAKRTPKAVRSALPILAKILVRHDRLNYRALLDRCCPSRVPKGRLTAQERKQIVEDLAEIETLQAGAHHSTARDVATERHPRTSGPSGVLTDSAHTNTPSKGKTTSMTPKLKVELPAPAARKPRYHNYAVPTTGQVAHFAKLAVKSLLPRDLFGSRHNQNLIFDTIGEFVRLRRFESFNLHQIAQSFRFADVDWALPPRASRKRRLSRHDAEARKKIVLEVLYWLFDGLLIPLLRTTFYVTETAAYRNRVLYFRQDDWHVLSRPVLGQLKETLFEPLTRAEALAMMSSRKLGYSHVRLLPKETGVRPIVNLRRRSTKQVHNAKKIDQEEGKSKSKRARAAAVPTAKQRKESLMLGQSINYILQSVFHVLTYEKSRMLAASTSRGHTLGDETEQMDVDMLTSSVFGPNEIYTQLKTFKQSLLPETRGTKASGSSKKPSKTAEKKLYFVKLDVRCAFDSIDQAKLLGIIEQILRKGEDEQTEGYRIHRFAKLMPSAVHEPRSAAAHASGANNAGAAGAVPSRAAHPRPSGTKREFVRLARPDSEHIDFIDLASSLAVSLHDVVFVDNVSYRYESTSLILKLLRQHVTENLIKIGKEFYRQRVGIPQGSSLSTLLCSFFYAGMEAQDPFLRSLRNGGTSDKKCLLMRYTDDFLLITTSKRQAKQFHNVMRKGHPEYGCFISPAKTLVNFDLVDPMMAAEVGPLVQRTYGDEFPWCGLTINTRDLGVSTDLTRYAATDMRDTLTVEYCRRPGVALVEKMIQSMKSRCHILFTDTALNGDDRVYANVYTSFVVAALKFSAYLAELRRFGITFTAEYLLKAIRRLVTFTSRYIGSRAASATAKLNPTAKGDKNVRLGRCGKRAAAWRVSCTVHAPYVHWLGYTAFLDVLRRQDLSYRPRRRKTATEEEKDQHIPYHRSMDSDTRRALVKLVDACVRRTCSDASRRRLSSIAAKALQQAQKSLHI